MYNRLYSTIKVKAADSDSWTFTGIASTPTPDRARDTINPQGAQFTLPLVLLWQHNHDSPIGHVTAATIEDSGITIEAGITQPTAEMPAGLSSRLREAWSSIKSGLVRGLSIGFVPTDFSPTENGGMDIKAWDWMELSAVTIPANTDASIQTVKHLAAPTHTGYALRSTHYALRQKHA